jgi:chaperonin cofactor prefoldin
MSKSNELIARMIEIESDLNMRRFEVVDTRLDTLSRQMSEMSRQLDRIEKMLRERPSMAA